MNPEQIKREALSLLPGDRAAIAEELFLSLERPDPELDKLWAEEVEARIDAVERGEAETVSEEEVFRK